MIKPMFFSGIARCQICARKKPCDCGEDAEPVAIVSTVIESTETFTSELVIGADPVDKFKELRKWKKFEFDELELFKEAKAAAAAEAEGAEETEGRFTLEAWPPITTNRYRSRHPPSEGCQIPQPEDRGITLRQLLAVTQYVQQHCENQGWYGSRPYNEQTENLDWLEPKPTVVGTFGKIKLTPNDVCLADLNLHLFIPATAAAKCSLVELVADSAADQKPRWFVSNW